MNLASPDEPGIVVLDISDQVFTFVDAQGAEWHWNASAGVRLVEASGRQPSAFHPSDHGLTISKLQGQYADLDLDYARTTNPTRPILFVPFWDGTSILIDGWHRTAGAILRGIPFLLCHELTKEEAEQVLVMKIPPPEAKSPKLAPMAPTRSREAPHPKGEHRQ